MSRSFQVRGYPFLSSLTYLCTIWSIPIKKKTIRLLKFSYNLTDFILLFRFILFYASAYFELLHSKNK